MIFVDGAGVDTISDYIKTRFPEAVKRARSMAVNDTARDALKFLAEEMRKEVKFPTGYLDEPQRLYISLFATPEAPVARVTARSRPTSLLRFAVGSPTSQSTRGKDAGGVNIEVTPGKVVNLKGGFVIALNGNNFGVAVKTSAQQISALKKHTFDYAQLAHAYYILYGPSVDQVFRGVATKYAAKVSEMLDTEFSRQLLVQIQR